MYKNIKLVLADIDGTLLSSQGVVTKRTIQSLQALNKQGIIFGIATGRTPYAVKHLLKHWGIDEVTDLIMGFNGGCCLDLHTGDMSSSYLLDEGVVEKILDDFKPFDFNAGIYDKEGFYCLKEDDLTKRIAELNILKLTIDKGFQSFKHKKVQKVLLIDNKDKLDEMQVYFQENLQDRPYKAVRSTDVLLELFHPELSKSKGIMKICENLNITPDQVLTFGDAMNDYEMIRDFNGVVMANGDEKVKAVAKAVTASNDEDGIAVFLEKYILK